MADAGLLFLINILWAAAYPFAKMALDSGMPPIFIAFFRWGVALVLLPIFATRVKRVPLKLRMPDLWQAIVLGAMGMGIVHILAFTGLSNTKASDATLLLAGEPLVMALMGLILLRERLRPAAAFAVPLGFAGAYLLINRGLLPPRTHDLAAFGNLLVTASVIIEGTTGVLSRGLVKRYPGVTVLFWEVVGAVIILAIPAAMQWRHMVHTMPPLSAWLCVLYLGLINSTFCYAVWFVLLERHNIGKLGIFIFIQPVAGAAMAVLFNKEHLVLWTIIGAAMVLAGVWLSLRADPETVPSAPE